MSVGRIEKEVRQEKAGTEDEGQMKEGALFLLGVHMGTSLWLLSLMHFHGTGLHLMLGFLFGD
jgi:hypothetical protein